MFFADQKYDSVPTGESEKTSVLSLPPLRA